MKKIGLLTREQIVEQIKEKIQQANASFFINFSKIEASPINTMRNNLKSTGAVVFVAKNSLFKRAFDDLGWENIDNFLEGETGVALVYDNDVVKTAKALVDFFKENENLKLKGGFLKDKKVDSAQITALAKLPARDVLLGMAVSSLAAPLTGFLNVLNQTILKFVWAIEEIKKKKS